MLVNVIILANH